MVFTPSTIDRNFSEEKQVEDPIVVPITIKDGYKKIVTVEVPAAHVEGGLAVTRDVEREGWRVTHTKSGLAFGDYLYRGAEDAYFVLRALLPLADWNLSREKLVSSLGTRRWNALSKKIVILLDSI